MPSELYESDTDENKLRAGVAEFWGTLVLTAAGITADITLKVALEKLEYSLSSLMPLFSVIGGFMVALVFGIALMAMVCMLGHISGAHLNPAITLGMAVTKNLPWGYVPLYIVSQMAGAAAGSWLVKVFNNDEALTIAKLGIPEPAAGVDIWDLLLVEAFITFLFVCVITAVTTSDRVPPSVVPLAAGAALTVAVFFAAHLTGGGVNPARALGPMIVSGIYPEFWWAYLLAPIVGGIVASFFYGKFLANAQKPDSVE
ncbi:MAG: hypothetical protein JWM07_740 [Candidatus Saccharibacteria bacterium]|nr:hypothetical protein [Candidatus Saccharibacteria bacterium]